MTLFDFNASSQLLSHGPLAHRMRPMNLNDFIGHSDIIGDNSIIKNALENNQLFSMIFWGPPGCGKTTKILEILANYIKGGLQLDQVLLIGFAKATVQELQNRVIKKGLLTEKQSESITTIHKFCLDKIGKPDILNSSAKTSFRKKMASDPDNWVM